MGAGALPPLLGWMHNRGCGAPVVFGSSATAVRRSSNVTWSTTVHGEVCVDRVRPKWNFKCRCGIGPCPVSWSTTQTCRMRWPLSQAAL